MTIHEADARLLSQLYTIYDKNEASAITDLVMERLTGWKRVDRLLKKNTALSGEKTSELERYLQLLSAHTPVQYVLQEAWFYGLKFFVNSDVLIPRPETEELAEWILSGPPFGSLLDVGTGSGCIPVVIKKHRPTATVTACDITSAALKVAEKNAVTHGTHIHWLQADILDTREWDKFGLYDVIVSNPPYIPLQQKNEMQKNVVLHEPHTALFVSDIDPLIFYRTIAAFGKKNLTANGRVFLEMHEDRAANVAALFGDYRSVTVRKDMQGKERMLCAEI